MTFNNSFADTANQSPIIILSDLKKSFVTAAEKLTVLDGLNATVQRGTSLVITGESGSGKTTLLHLIATIDRPSAGQIIIGDLAVNGAGEAELAWFRNRRIGLVFQFHYLLKEFSALENVCLPARMAGLNAKLAIERGQALLAEVGLSERAGHFPSQLSGGERQRVAVARALVNDPDLILADEPTGNLDERNANEVERLLFDLSRRYQKTLVLVTHNQAIAKVGQAHWHLRHGQIEKPLSRDLP